MITAIELARAAYMNSRDCQFRELPTGEAVLFNRKNRALAIGNEYDDPTPDGERPLWGYSWCAYFTDQFMGPDAELDYGDYAPTSQVDLVRSVLDTFLAED